MKVKFQRQAGFYSMVFGVIILSLLLLCNVAWFSFEEDLYRTGKPKLPPYISLFQDLLYDSPEPQENIQNNSLFNSNPFGGLNNQNANESERDEYSEGEYFVSNPERMVSIGNRYIYHPKFAGNENPSLSIIQAPDNFAFRDSSVVWTPDSSQIGDHTIQIAAERDNGITHTQLFTLHVSEYSYTLGTDERGRSVAGLLIEGSSWTLLPGMIAAFTAIFLGVTLGAISGYSQGRISDNIDFSVQVLESIPGLLLFFLAAVISRFNIYWVMVAVGLAFAPVNVKLIRSMVRKFVQNQFVEASKEIGFKEHVVLWRDIIWVNGKSTIATQICYCFAFAILTEVTLSYLQIGVQLSDGVSWGTLLIQGKSNFSAGNYWLLIFPGLAIVLSILGFYMLGDGLGKILDYRQSD